MNAKNAVFVRREEIEHTLKMKPTQGKHMLEPFASFVKSVGLPFSILEDVRLFENDAEIHMREGDLWFCLEGEATFIYGGELVNPRVKKNLDGTEDKNELKGKSIAGGTTIVFRSGDWLWIPAGVPHQHTASDKVRMVIAKIPEI